MSAWRRPDDVGGYAPWVRELRGYSGVYAIRSASSGDVLYVGESHTGRLYETMTRHFQSSSSLYKGPTYARERCEVRVEVLNPEYVLDEQLEWLRRLQPRDNELMPVDLVDDDDVPF